MITTSPLGEGLGNTVAAQLPMSPKRADKSSQEEAVTMPAPVGSASTEAVSVSLQSQSTASSGTEANKPSASEEASRRIREMVDQLQKKATSLEFQINEADHRIVVRVINRATGEVIRQIPPEEMLKSNATNDLRGILFNQAS